MRALPAWQHAPLGDGKASAAPEITADDLNALPEEGNVAAALIASLPGYFILFDINGCLVRWNRALAELTGLSDEQLRHTDPLALVIDRDRAVARDKLSETLAAGFSDVEFGMRDKNGVLHTIRWTGKAVTIKGRPHLLAIGMDVTQIREAEGRLADSERKMITIFNSVQAGILIIDPERHQIVDVNPAAARMFGAPREAIIGQHCQKYVCPAEVGKCPITDLGQDVDNSERVLINSAGAHVPIIKTVSTVVLGSKPYLIESFVDITARKHAEDELAFLAKHDSLTSLPNRVAFVEALHAVSSLLNRGGRTFGVLYIDLDHFKDVNDTLGHPAGDQLLREIASRLRSGIRKGDIVARFGGDEFALIASSLSDPMDAAMVAEKLLKSIGQPCSIRNQEIRVGASIGIAYYETGAPDPEVILSQADLALYRSKFEGRGTYRFFTSSMDQEVRDRVTLGAQIAHAITSNQLRLAYQPQINIDTGQIIGLEALVRWAHPVRGLVLPDKFLPVTEHIGLIVPLGRWVLHEACRQMREWIDCGIAPPQIAINVSAMQFRTPHEIDRDIAATLRENGLQPERLELELTESALMTVTDENDDAIARLRSSGVHIAIDDFGNGYSSLAYLSRLPVNRIKIAQNFVADIASNARNAAIVKAAIGMAHDLGLDVVVEGVEMDEQLALIKSWDAHNVQGFYFSRPLPGPEIEALLRVGKTLPRVGNAQG